MIGRDEASAQLALIDSARRDARALGIYAGAGRSLIGWGLVWLICNLISQAAPDWAGTAWTAGIAVMIVAGLAMRPPAPRKPRDQLSALAIAGFIGLAVSIFGTADPLKVNAFITLCVALAYILVGIWAAPRFAGLGLIIAMLAAVGWFVDRAHLAIWLGLGGGGALIVSGLILRRA